MSNTDIQFYKEFEEIFMNLLDHHSPFTKEIFRTNNTPNIIKKIRKVIKDLILNKFIRKLSQNSQRNYVSRYKKEIKMLFSSLKLSAVSDNRKF